MKSPESAPRLAPRLGLTRQKLNDHLRELEREGFLEVVEQRQRRGCVERVLKVTSRAFVVNPAVLGQLADDPTQARDRFSSAHLLSTATALIRDVAVLSERARESDRAPIAVRAGIRIGTMSRHTGYASLPLHGGKAPAWLFGRMVRLSREIVIYLASRDRRQFTAHS